MEAVLTVGAFGLVAICGALLTWERKWTRDMEKKESWDDRSI